MTGAEQLQKYVANKHLMPECWVVLPEPVNSFDLSGQNGLAA